MTLLTHILTTLLSILCLTEIHTLTEASRRDVDLSQQDIIALFKNIAKDVEVVLPGQIPEALKPYQNAETQARKSSDKNRKFTRVKFVKRVVPHGQETLNEEYDPVQKTLYKPLFVIHQRADIPQKYNRDFLQYIAENIQKNNEEPDDEALLEPFKNLPNENLYQPKKTKVTKKIDKKTCSCPNKKNCPHAKKKRASSTTKFKRQRNKRFYRDLWKAFQDSLRSVALRQFDKSGEEPETLANLVKKFTVDSAETPPSKHNYPYYPFWNWWIYKETVYHDECEEYQVKIGGVCIKVPEH